MPKRGQLPDDAERLAAPDAPVAPDAPTRPARAVTVVGIGCSAGGLEALMAFFGQVPADSGLAFVVVQHLDPDRASNLPALLQRETPLQVFEAADGMPVHPDCVFVIPPAKDLSIQHGLLRLLEPVEARGLRLPVDFFLRTLAAERTEHAIGVVLSGMGSDGVLGLRAIKAAGGLTLAQEPASARSDSMPASAIAAGTVDIVAPAEQLPGRILDFLCHGRPLARGVSTEPALATQGDDGEAALARIAGLLSERCGNDFALYKSGTLRRRVERRIALHQLDGFAGYLRHVRSNPPELDLLFREMLIGVTSFFRDPEVWKVLREVILPEVLMRHPSPRAFRAWVPACSSGEEAYTLAMVFREAVAETQAGPRHTLQIYATDLDADAIAKARKALYPKNIALDVGPERMARFFVDENDHYRISKEVRDMVVFAQQNIVSDPPFTKLDLLTCRNLLIYFGPELQRKVVPLFHYALNRDGLLVLGNAETVGPFDRLFSAADARHHVYRRLDEVVRVTSFPIPANPLAHAIDARMTSRPHAESLGQLIDQLVQQAYAPAAVLVGADGDILYISGRTGKYLEPAAGRVNVNIHAMAREGLNSALTGAIRKALAQEEPVLLRGITVGTNGGTQHVDVTVQGLTRPEALRGRVLIVFKDVEAPIAQPGGPKAGGSSKVGVLTRELQECREALRILREETQASLEELKSANEELQSTNEEMQSTNEEMTTSREEMQSMNEEMRTVNTELQSKVYDLTWERNDMANLLNSTEIATVFLDSQMRLRRFTAFATKLFKLIPGDVGRPLSDLATELDYPQLRDDAAEVLRTLVFSEKEVSASNGRWYRARIMPYRTQDNMIDGVVSTFVDITQIKALEVELRRLGGES